MPGRTDIRQAIAEVLNNSELNGSWTITPWMNVPPLPPMIEVFAKRSQYNEGFSTDELRFTVRATVGSTISPAGQQMLDELIDASGDNSIRAILEAEVGGGVLIQQNQDLLGYVQDLTVEEHSDPHSYPVQGADGPGHILGIELTVCVLTTRPSSDL